MLRIHFLNVGYGDCTVISHPSGRLTMIDINNSQDYDSESFQELLKEERNKASAYSGLASYSYARTNALQAGSLGAGLNSPFAYSHNSIFADARNARRTRCLDIAPSANMRRPIRALILLA
jgi:hypothetical protein